MNYCSKCSKYLNNPIVIDGVIYGSTCAKEILKKKGKYLPNRLRTNWFNKKLNKEEKKIQLEIDF